MMHVVGSTPKSPKRSDSKTTLEPRSVESTAQNSAQNETPIVTIEVPVHSPEDSPIEDSTPKADVPKAVRPTFASKNNLTTLNIISVNVMTDKPKSPATPITDRTSVSEEAAESVTESTTGLIHAINLAPARRSAPSAPTQITTYSINNTHRYLQPYPLNTTPLTPTIRRHHTPKLPWLECGGGLAAFTIISGVVAIDGLKQSPTAPRPNAQQQTQPTIARLPNNPTSIPQVSVSELLNTGRTLPVPTGAMNFPQQIAMNSSPQNLSPQNPGLNAGNAEMNSIVVQQEIGNTQQIPQPSVRKAVATPERLPQAPVKTVELPVQRPIQAPVQLPAQPPLPQSSPPFNNNPAFTPQAAQPVEQPSSAMPPSQSQDAQFLEVPASPGQPALNQPANQPVLNQPPTSAAIPPLQNDRSLSPTTLKPIRSSMVIPSETLPSLSSSPAILLEANPQASLGSINSDDALRLEVSKL